MLKLVNVLAIIVLCANLEAIAQKPTILSTDKEYGGAREVVTLRGSDFGADKTKLKVFFGAAAAEIKEVSNQIMEVRVPAAATYDNISVTNTTNGLTGYSPGIFNLKFGGKHGLTAASFNEEPHFDAEDGLYDLCLCDFNGDNKTDIATASDKSSGMVVFENKSTLASINLDDNFILINRKSLHITCGDLNGDGRPDMAASEGADGDRIYIYRSTGGMSFSSFFISLSGKKVKRTAIADLDLDGKPDLVVTDKGGNSITIFPNQSAAGGAITFGAPIAVPIADVPSTDALDIEDLNGDGLPEILTSKFNTISNIYISQNKSTPGNFNFSDIITLDVSGSVVNVRVGDLDGDHKPDIAATRFLGSDIVILRNQSTASQITFTAPVAFATTEFPSGLDFGDLDGDGKTDIVVGSISVKSLVVLNNKSTPGALGFEPALSIPTDFVNRHVRIGDLDGDGKPDIAYTSIDNSGVLSSKISVFRNKSCFVPVLSPAGPLTICNGFPLQLASSTSGGVTYSWQKTGAPVAGTNPFLDITAGGAYTVTATSEAGTCSETSAAVNITVAAPGAGLTAGDANAASNSPVCTENTLTLQVADLGAAQYKWTGPNGFTATGRTPSLNNFSLNNAGLYVVELITSGGCVAKVDTTVVEGINNPDFTITFSGSDLLCQGSTKTLNISPVLTSGFTYQWFEKTQGLIPTQTSNAFNATASGEYYATVASTHPGCAPVATPEVKITAVAVPDASFSPSTTSACVGQEISFNNQSVVDPQVTPTYTWTFADNSTNSSETSPKHTFTNAATYQVKLKVTYQNGVCPNEETIPVTIILAPAVTITNPTGSFKLCANDTLRLVASGDIFASYAWSTGETTPFIIVDAAQTYSVSVTNSMGCTLQASQVVTPVSAPTVTATAQPEVITVGQFSMLSGTGLENYEWSPGLSLSDSTIANPVATPLQDITYTFSGTDINGCKGKATVSIRVLGTSVLDQIKPKSYFSPNDDITNPTWVVQDIDSFPECGVAIFNDKGAKVFEAKPYTNNWDGTFKGSKLPSGVYYYVIRCDDESNVKTGSITLLK